MAEEKKLIIGYKPKVNATGHENFDDDPEFVSNLTARHKQHLDTVDFTWVILNRTKRQKSDHENIPNYDDMVEDTEEITYTMPLNEHSECFDIEQLKFTGNVTNQKETDFDRMKQLEVIDNARPSICDDELPDVQCMLRPSNSS